MFWVVKNYWKCWKISKLGFNFKSSDMWIFGHWLEYFRNFYGENLVIFEYWKLLELLKNSEKCGIISSLLICKFLKICWDIFESFNVENLFYWIIGECWNCWNYWNYWETLELWHSFASWLCEEVMKIVKSVWKGKK